MQQGNIRMEFICNQNWDAMGVTGRGRFCDACRKEVVDFTNTSIDRIKAERNYSEELCGRFRIEQVDPTLIAPVRIPKKLKQAAFLSSIMLVVSAKISFGQTRDTIRTEQTDSSFQSTPGKVHIPGYKIPKNKGSEVPAVCSTPTPEIQKKNYKWYWSWRFPFLRRVYIGERHIMGYFR